MPPILYATHNAVKIYVAYIRTGGLGADLSSVMKYGVALDGDKRKLNAAPQKS